VVRRGCTALALALLLSGRVLAAEPTGTLEVRVLIDEAEVVLHEQVLLRIEVTHPLWAQPRWHPPIFEGMWSERLSSLGGPLHRRAGGETLRNTTFRRALLPTRAGTLEIGPSTLHYHDEEGQARTQEVSGTQIHVVALPKDGRPEGFRDIVGQLRIESRLSTDVLELGDSLMLSIEAYGTANVWNLEPSDLEPTRGERFEVFSKRPRLILGEQGSKLTARRSFSFDLVPRATGNYTVPALALSYFDPVTRRYREARSDPLAFRVAAPAKPRPRRSPSAAQAAPSRSLPWIPVTLLLLVVLAACGWGLARWWQRSPRTWRGPTPPPPRTLFENARKAIGSESFPALLAQAIKARIHVRHHLDVLALSSEEIAQRIDDGEALELLRTLDQARFGKREADPQELLASARRYLGL
jgi:hypothetical protein